MSKSREVGIKVHNGVAKGLKAVWFGVKTAGSSVKDVAVGAVTGLTAEEIEERRSKVKTELLAEKAEAGLDPESKLYKDLERDVQG